MTNMLRASIAIASIVAASLSFAQSTYPVKPIRFIAPFPPGGSSDVLSRLLGQKLAELLGQPITIENRGGAGGNIGSEFAANLPADGYNWLLGSSPALATNVHLYKRMGFDPLNDFNPVSMIGVSGSVLVVHPSVQVNTVAELIALAKSQPGKLNYGSGGIGSPAHVIAESFKTLVGVDMVHVPYKGTGVAVTDLVAGQLHLIFSDMVPTIPQIRAGKLRPIAVTLAQRIAVLPDVPTLGEVGVGVKVGETWWALMLPKGAPAPIIERLNTEMGRTLRMPEVIERMGSLGVAPMHSTPQAVTERIHRDSPEFGKILKAAGVQPE
ncbi:MAG: tripartite tricarboxylate transporter substrate binding protein [Betaproteobacteria bacterium]|nr:tripartite tricarboxylate transporter substrate binding protein [Betaproteobacteria bacterium]